MRHAWDGANAELAKKQLQRLAASLHAKHPGAAASLREGLEETLTVQTLGTTGALYRTLRTTNPIENLNGSIAHFTRNVKRWKDGQMTLRWVAGALSDAKGRFRKLRGHRDMKLLLAALKARSTDAIAGRTQGRVASRMRSRHPGRVQQRSGHRLPGPLHGFLLVGGDGQRRAADGALRRGPLPVLRAALSSIAVRNCRTWPVAGYWRTAASKRPGSNRLSQVV